jgi:aryl-phospho-beta-D-glucosidase BglC (GH1 family)
MLLTISCGDNTEPEIIEINNDDEISVGVITQTQTSEQAQTQIPPPAVTATPADITTDATTTTAENTTAENTAAVTAIPATTTATNPAQTQRPDSVTAPAVTTTAQNTPAPQALSSGDLDVVLNIPNSWESGSDRFVQLDVVVRNKGTREVSGWTVEIPVGSRAVVDQHWNFEFKQSGGTLTTTPVGHNMQISPGGEITFGMILKNSELTGEAGVSGTTGGGNNTAQIGSVGNNNPAISAGRDVPAPTSTDWLYARGNQIVTRNGTPVWITGVNWFGYNTGTNTFDGLWTACLNSSLAAIADRGFNMLRIPISTELIKNWSNGIYPTANFNQATNHYLVGMSSLEIFDYVIGQCRANGIKIMIDIHSAESDPMGHMHNMWFRGSITEKDFIDGLAWMARRYANDDTILMYDLKNEPHGKPNESPRAKWDGSTDPDNWKYVAEKAALAVLRENPNVMVLVEGIEIYPRDIVRNPNFTSTRNEDYYFTWWGGNLRGVRHHPIELGRFQNKLVYSPHDYGPTVYNQPWFSGNYTFDSLMRDAWRDNWFFIYEEEIAPVLIGEWGGFMREPNLKWMTYFRRLIKENRLHHTFWCFNANSGDTGGLVLHDFATWDEEKYEFVKEVLWQQDGKFVGLDSQIPLGRNGIALKDLR